VEDLGVDGRIILEWMLGKSGGNGSYEHANETLGSIKDGGFLD
jgi:hypothetical protein